MLIFARYERNVRPIRKRLWRSPTWQWLNESGTAAFGLACVPTKMQMKILLASMVLLEFVNVCTYLNRAHSTLRFSQFQQIWHRKRNGMHWSDCGIHRKKNWTNFTKNTEYEFNAFPMQSEGRHCWSWPIARRASTARLVAADVFPLHKLLSMIGVVVRHSSFILS